MTNPKAALMWVAVSMFLASAGLSGPLFLLIGLGAALSAMLIYGGYALVFSTGIAVRTYGRFFRLIEASFGAVFGFVGTKLVMVGLRDLRSCAGASSSRRRPWPPSAQSFRNAAAARSTCSPGHDTGPTVS